MIITIHDRLIITNQMHMHMDPVDLFYNAVDQRHNQTIVVVCVTRNINHMFANRAVSLQWHQFKLFLLYNWIRLSEFFIVV